MPSNTITMKKSDFVKEHKKLIKLLNQGQKLVKEAKEQKNELEKYKKSKSSKSKK
jgi:hemerythrin